MDITLLMTMCTRLISFVHHISGIIKEGWNEGMSERKKYNRKKKEKRSKSEGKERKTREYKDTQESCSSSSRLALCFPT